MSKIVTLRLPEPTHRRFVALAKSENRSLSNFIETAVLRYTESEQFVSDFEMMDIRNDTELNKSLKKGLKDAKGGDGQFI